MHGISTSIPDLDDNRFATRGERLRSAIRRRRGLLIFVVIPALVIALYYGLIASDQYVSEAHYIVRAADTPAPTGGGIGQVFGLVGVSPSQSESYSVSDYLSSSDAVNTLRQKLDLVSIFRRPGVDFLSSLHPADPSPERLFRFYTRQVNVRYNNETGITTLRVRTFRPADSVAVVKTLLDLGEARVNALNKRAYQSTIANAQNQFNEAENAIAVIQGRMTGFRHETRDIDPEGTGQSQTQLVSRLRQAAAEARAQLMASSGSISPNSPQIVALRARLRALESQVASEGGRLTGGGGDIATGLGSYEALKLRQEFAAKRYEAAAAALERAREQAQKQQLFIIRVVEPNYPQTSLYPERVKVILSAIAALLLIYGIGWLIFAGVKEHAA